MKKIFLYFLFTMNIKYGFSDPNPPLIEKQIFKEINFIIEKTRSGSSINRFSKIDKNYLELFSDTLKKSNTEIIKIFGELSEPKRKEALVLIIPDYKYRHDGFYWDHKFALLLFYQFSQNKWNLMSVNSFYSSIDTIAVNPNQVIIKSTLDKCINGKCNWQNEFYTISTKGKLSLIYSKETHSNLPFISTTLSDKDSRESINDLSLFQKGDTLSYTVEDFNFSDSNNDNILEITETTIISKFENYDGNKFYYKTYITKREYKFINNEIILIKTLPTEEKNEVYP